MSLLYQNSYLKRGKIYIKGGSNQNPQNDKKRIETMKLRKTKNLKKKKTKSIPKKILPNKGRQNILPNVSNYIVAMIDKFVCTSITFKVNNP